MTTTPASPWCLAHLPAAELLGGLDRLVARERQLTAELLAHLAEVDARRLYLEAACSSMFGYCVERLHLSEPAAYRRVRAARAAREFPVIFEMVARGEVHLATITLLAPHLTEANHEELLAAAVHQSKRAVEELVAARFPAPDVASLVRRLPAPQPAALPLMACATRVTPPVAAPPPPPPVAVPSRPPVVAPLAADRYRVQFTATREVRDRLREAQDLLRRDVPDGDLNAIVGRALDLLVRDLKRRQFGHREYPRSRVDAVDGTRRSAHIPNAVKRAVAERDGYQCTYVDAEGNRCTERGRLEFHHCEPQGQGGVHRVETITLRCHGHHALATARDYGADRVARAISERERAGELAPGRVRLRL
jgi:hypothetical protein